MTAFTELANRAHARVKEGIEDKNGAKEGSSNFLGPNKGLPFLSGPYKEFTLIIFGSRKFLPPKDNIHSYSLHGDSIGHNRF
jgi:hypothetical protein